MPTYKKIRYHTQLPATPCTVQLREAMLEQAIKKGVSLAEIQRQAFSLFLSTIDSKATRNISLDTIEK